MRPQGERDAIEVLAGAAAAGGLFEIRSEYALQLQSRMVQMGSVRFQGKQSETSARVRCVGGAAVIIKNENRVIL